jgi:hypothetical protein
MRGFGKSRLTSRIIVVAILHAMGVALPNMISHYRANSKKKSKSKA